MTDNPSADFRANSGASASKRAAPNLSGGWLVMILSFLIAMVIYFYVTQQSNQQFSIAVAAQDLSPGSKVTAESFRQVQVNVPRAQLDRLLAFDDIEEVTGFVASGAILAGDPIIKSSLRQAAATDGLRAMSIPNAAERSVAGALSIGDRVDIVNVVQVDADLRFVARDLEVLAVNTGGGAGALGGGGNFSVTVAVAPVDAARISAAINDGKIDIIRSTGATPLTGPRPGPLGVS